MKDFPAGSVDAAAGDHRDHPALRPAFSPAMRSSARRSASQPLSLATAAWRCAGVVALCRLATKPQL